MELQQYGTVATVTTLYILFRDKDDRLPPTAAVVPKRERECARHRVI